MAARVRLGGIKMADPPARVRLGGITMSGSATTTPRVRLGGIRMSGGLVTEPRVRIGGIMMSGTSAVIIEEFVDLVGGDPGDPLDITAVLAPGSPAPEEYIWTQTGGPAVDYTTNDNVLSLLTPAFEYPGDSVEFSVAGRVGITMSPITTIEITPLPETEWSWSETLNKWVGARRLP
jgi:hypothetical protein